MEDMELTERLLAFEKQFMTNRMLTYISLSCMVLLAGYVLLFQWQIGRNCSTDLLIASRVVVRAANGQRIIDLGSSSDGARSRLLLRSALSTGPQVVLQANPDTGSLDISDKASGRGILQYVQTHGPLGLATYKMPTPAHPKPTTAAALITSPNLTSRLELHLPGSAASGLRLLLDSEGTGMVGVTNARAPGNVVMMGTWQDPESAKLVGGMSVGGPKSEQLLDMTAPLVKTE